jgi:hypothetical protein
MLAQTSLQSRTCGTARSSPPFQRRVSGKQWFESRFAGRLAKRGISIPPGAAAGLYQGTTSVVPIKCNKIAGFSPCRSCPYNRKGKVGELEQGTQPALLPLDCGCTDQVIRLGQHHVAKGTTLKYSSSLKILWICAVAVFVVAEAEVFIKFWRIPDDHLFVVPGTKFFIAFIVALPMVAGVSGVYSVRRRIQSAGDDVISAISLQFLFTIITAYTALVFCMGQVVARPSQRF